MVANEDWAEVCTGLVDTAVCTFVPVEEIFDTGQGPLLNGMFGVSKEEWVGETEVFRLIMNLIPLISIAHPLRGDVETLPMWSMMNPFFLKPSAPLLIGSEDARCFFYIMAVPCTWYKHLALNKPVPTQCLPPSLRWREVYLAAKVLPMGFLNSVSLAQHVHRNLSLWSGRDGQEGAELNPPEKKIRKDRPPTVGDPSWQSIWITMISLSGPMRRLRRLGGEHSAVCFGTPPGVRALGHSLELKEKCQSAISRRSSRRPGGRGFGGGVPP